MKKKALLCTLLYALLIFQSFQAFSQETPEMSEGMKLFYARNLDAAKEQFKTAFEKEPNNSLPLLFLLDCYAQEKNLQPILNSLEEAAVDKPDSAIAKAHLGMGYFALSLLKSDTLDEALTQFQDALKIDNNLALGYLGMGIIYYQKRMIPRSRSYFSKAVKLNPADVVAAERLGEIFLVDDKNPQSALTILERIPELYPTYPDGYFYCASAYQELGEFNKAIELYEKSSQLDPRGAGKGYYAPERIGDIYYRLKDFPKAIEYYEKSLKINPANSYSKKMLERVKNPPKEEEKPKTKEEEKPKTKEGEKPKKQG